MHQEPQVALQKLIGALERHLDAILSQREGEDPGIEQAYIQVEDAFLSYEEALSASFDEYLPMELAEEE
jgi:predicted component of type VI protein secretion system